VEQQRLLLILWFAVFLLIAFSAVPLVIKLFVYLQIRIGNGEHWLIRWLDGHRWPMTFAFWGVFTLGLLIAVPTMLREGFFNPETTDPATAPVAPGAQPPLEYQIRHADSIVVALTENAGGNPAYTVVSAWKGGRTTGERLQPSIESFRLLGYAPREQESVVMFETGAQLVELLPVRDYRIVYAPHDATVRRNLNLDELYQLVISITAAN
jgi:hypothetical protein